MTTRILLRAGLFHLLALLVASSALHAQTPAANSTTFRTLALGKSLSNVYYDHDGKAVRITAGSSGFSSPYPGTPGSEIELYRELPPDKPGEVPRRVSLSTFELGEVGPFLILIKVDPENPDDLLIKVVDDSWELHPLGFMRVFNYSPRKALVKVGEEITELNPTQSHQFPYSDKLQVWLQAAVLEEEEWVLRVSAPQVIVPDSRSTVVMIDQEPSEDRPVTDALLVRNFIERAPQPTK